MREWRHRGTETLQQIEDQDTFKDIARSSTHTILAANGREHRENKVYHVQRPLTFNHIERLSGGLAVLGSYCSSADGFNVLLLPHCAAFVWVVLIQLLQCYYCVCLLFCCWSIFSAAVFCCCCSLV